MTQFDPKPVASTSSDDLQDAINKLVGMKLQQGANIAEINLKIEVLIDKQADLQNLALIAVEATPAAQQAIAAVNKAAAALKNEVENIGKVATCLTDAGKVLAEVTSLLTALTPFI